MRQDLEDFVGRVRRLDGTSLLRRAVPTAMEISYRTLQSGWSVSEIRIEEPPEEELVAFLTVLRPLTLIGERTSLRNVHNLCRLHSDDPALWRAVAECWQAWKRAQRATHMKLVIDDREWRPDYVADLLINGHYFHDDGRKKAELERLGHPERMFVRHQFLTFVLQAGQVARVLGRIVDEGLANGRFR